MNNMFGIKWNNKLKPTKVKDPMAEMERLAKGMESNLTNFGNFNALNQGKMNKALNKQAKGLANRKFK